jgi:hypothetical protein
MPKVRGVFQKIVQDVQNYQSFDKNADHMVSIFYFLVEVGGKRNTFIMPYSGEFEVSESGAESW